MEADRVESLLPLSATLMTYCRQHSTCRANRHVRRAVEALTNNLQENCLANGDKQMKKVRVIQVLIRNWGICYCVQKFVHVHIFAYFLLHLQILYSLKALANIGQNIGRVATTLNGCVRNQQTPLMIRLTASHALASMPCDMDVRYNYHYDFTCVSCVVAFSYASIN